MPILTRQQIRIVEGRLHNYENMKLEVKAWRSDVIGMHGKAELIPGQGYHSDAVRDAVEKLENPPSAIKNKMAWIHAIDKVRDRIKGTTGEAVLSTWYGQPAQTIDEACAKAHVARSAFVQWRERIVMGVAIYAAASGVLRV